MINCRDFRRSLVFIFQPTAAILDDQLPRFWLDKNTNGQLIEDAGPVHERLGPFLGGILVDEIEELASSLW